jgi:hypothetical protein
MPEASVAASVTETGDVNVDEQLVPLHAIDSAGGVVSVEPVIVIVWLSCVALPALSVAIARTVEVELTVKGPL